MDTFFSQLSSLSLLSITVRLLLTTVFAGTLGYERERHRQAAGFRTYIIVADAAALVMMTNLYIGDVFGSTDLVRMPASVITGLGFLGAGTILVTKSHEIKGLTTAAGASEEIVTAALDFSVLAEVRNSINVFHDRRPELYRL